MEQQTLLAICCFLLCSKGVAVAAFKANIPNETIAVERGTAVFEISYTLGSGEKFKSFSFNKGLDVIFTAPGISGLTLLPNGSFSIPYSNRTSTNYYYGRTQFTITLSRLKASDQGEYTVIMAQEGGFTVDPVVTQLVFDVLPLTPYISGAPTQTLLGGAEPTVLTCTANLGKPKASMVWSRRIGNSAYTNITENFTMTTANNNDGTTNGTSVLTVNLDGADDGVQFRCQVSNRQASLYAETKVIKVTDTIKPTESGEGGETVKPTENGKGGDTVKPTGNGEGGVSVGCDDIPNKILLGAAFGVMAMITPF